MQLPPSNPADPTQHITDTDRHLQAGRDRRRHSHLAGGSGPWEEGSRSGAIRRRSGLCRHTRAKIRRKKPSRHSLHALLRQLCEFLRRRGGRCSSQQLVARFRADCSDPTLFKQLLRQAARRDDGENEWVLREGFARG